jgi:hypothetical protein
MVMESSTMWHDGYVAVCRHTGQTEAERHAVAVLAALSIVSLAVEVMQAQNSGSGKK